jgi:signal peptidase I
MSDSPPPATAAPYRSRRARHVLAVIVALIWPSGPGHILIGHKRRGWAWGGAVAAFLVLAALLAVATGSGRFMIACIAGLLSFHVLSAIDVARLERSHPPPGIGAFVLHVVLLTGALSLVAVGVRVTLIEAFQIPSGSMLPTLNVGDHIFVNKRARQYTRGDVVVFLYPLDPSTSYIQRVIGVGGDVVQMNDGQLSINGRLVDRREVDTPEVAGDPDATKVFEESFDGRAWLVTQERIHGPRDFPATTVPPDHYFLVGDNRDNSSDSRVWGFVSQDLMLGTAMTIWMSSKPDGSIDWSRLNAPVR